MADRYFYKTDGSREKVPQAKYDELIKRQSSAIRAHGREVWTDRRGRQYSVDDEELRRRELNRETARRASRIGWDAIASEKAAQREQWDRETIVYPGPTSGIITSWEEVRQFRADVYDWAAAAVAIDARKGEYCVSVEIESHITTPTIEDEPSGIIKPALLVVRDGEIVKHDKSEIDDQMRTLFDGVKGMRKYPTKQKRKEVKPGKVIKGTVKPEGEQEGHAAEGFSAYLTSTITLTPC
jgi:hypothetical protein